MKKFLSNLLLIILIFVFFCLLGMLLPPTPRRADSLYMSKIFKDSLSQATKGPRVIFLGGSNLSFGLNSQVVRDSLKMNVVDVAIDWTLGLSYMLQQHIKYIKKGDVIVLSPEYNQYYDDFAYGDRALVMTARYASKTGFRDLTWRQVKKNLWLVPEFSLSVFTPDEYLYKKNPNDVYSRRSYNEYGDAVVHWRLPRVPFQPLKSLGSDFNYGIMNEIVDFSKKVKEKGAAIYITYPAFQTTSFNNCNAQIALIETELKKTDIKILGTPGRYKFADSLMFNFPYHLIKKGVDIRTNFLISDIKGAINRDKN